MMMMMMVMRALAHAHAHARHALDTAPSLPGARPAAAWHRSPPARPTSPPARCTSRATPRRPRTSWPGPPSPAAPSPWRAAARTACRGTCASQRCVWGGRGGGAAAQRGGRACVLMRSSTSCGQHLHMHHARRSVSRSTPRPQALRPLLLLVLPPRHPLRSPEASARPAARMCALPTPPHPPPPLSRPHPPLHPSIATGR